MQKQCLSPQPHYTQSHYTVDRGRCNTKGNSIQCFLWDHGPYRVCCHRLGDSDHPVNQSHSMTRRFQRLKHPRSEEGWPGRSEGRLWFKKTHSFLPHPSANSVKALSHNAMQSDCHCCAAAPLTAALTWAARRSRQTGRATAMASAVLFHKCHDDAVPQGGFGLIFWFMAKWK